MDAESTPPIPGLTRTERSEAWLQRARLLFPGGVNSPGRSFRAIHDLPRVIARAEGSRLHDVDGHAYVDLSMSRGAALLGHAAPAVRDAVVRALSRGSNFDAPCQGEVLLAERVAAWLPSAEKLRFVQSELEAVMAALRVARAFTGRDGVVKLEGQYHGDLGALQRMAVPAWPGVGFVEPAGFAQGAMGDTSVAPYNDVDALRRILQNHPCEIAAVILEPVCTSHGVVPPQPGYLAAVRELTREWGVLLVFDETATGFRMGRGGAQEFYGVSPDLTVLGRALGGGLPIGALCGRAELISLLAPDGPLFQSGTFSGNPLAMAAGLAVLEAMEDDRGYAVLEARGAYLERALVEAASAARVTVQVQRVASMMTLYFHPRPVTRWSEVSRCDTRAFAAFARGMYPRGVYLPPAPFETMYLSLAHTSEDLDFIAARAAEAFLEV